MKTSSKFKVAGTILLIIGVILVILSSTVAKTCTNCGRGWEDHRDAFGESYSPNLGLGFFGGVAIMGGIALLVNGFRPQIAKTNAKLNNETLDEAGKDISEVMNKTVDVVDPAIGKAVTNIQGHIKGLDKKSRLDEAKALYENGDITKEEYEAMRKDILNIDN